MLEYGWYDKLKLYLCILYTEWIAYRLSFNEITDGNTELGFSDYLLYNWRTNDMLAKEYKPI
jgi:hypothetical protein